MATVQKSGITLMTVPNGDAESSSPSALSANRLNQEALALRSRGEAGQAAALLHQAVEIDPGRAELWSNLAQLLDEGADPAAALAAYAQALTLDPHFAPAHSGCGAIHLRAGAYDPAERAYRRVLEITPADVGAHLALYELLQIRGEPAAALEHQAAVLAHQQLFSLPAPHPERRILALCAPGDWQANIPLEFLFDRATTTVQKLYLCDISQLSRLTIPAYDIVFNAIAESDAALAALGMASQLLKSQNRPHLNDPAAVLRTNRVTIQEVLRTVDCVLPRTMRLPYSEIQSEHREYPLLIRPVGSHAGHNLEKIDDGASLSDYLARVQSPDFYITSFVDYKRADGFYRKYRIIFVDGVPYPYHLAISPAWMIHYYNAPMAENAWMREEEAAFLADFEGVFGKELQHTLRELAHALGLDYFGIDCSIDPHGRLLLFEADAAMIVHTGDPIELYPYKHEYVPRIFKALERMIDTRIARSC
ncbi:MAG: tetratricopeptide repeat protein [Candidatus Baltobacteraceae bacterium]